MPILVLNSGSSSIKFSVFAACELGADPTLLFDGELSGVGTPSATLTSRTPASTPAKLPADAATPLAAIHTVLDAVLHSGLAIDAVGYRVVHPGAKIAGHTRITDEVLRDLEAAAAFAPLHDPEAVSLIRATMQRFPSIGHFACFDTVFHQTMPAEASTYPIPAVYREQGARRYGFHGLSCESIVRQLRQQGPLPPRLVIAHLGSGCSVTAVLDGRSIDTSMGLTPTGGVVMGTRPGDLDPGLLVYLLRQQKEKCVDAVETMLNHAAGMVALSGRPNDVQALRTAAAQGDAPALLALKVFTRSVTKAIGGFCWLLGGLDAIAFSGGIGEHDAATRAEVLAGLEDLQIAVNCDLNLSARGDYARISASQSRTAVFVVPAREDLTIAMHVQRMARSGNDHSA